MSCMHVVIVNPAFLQVPVAMVKTVCAILSQGEPEGQTQPAIEHAAGQEDEQEKEREDEAPNRLRRCSRLPGTGTDV